MTITLQAMAEPIPADSTVTGQQFLTLEAAGTDYQAAKAALFAQLQAGWRLIWLRTI